MVSNETKKIPWNKGKKGVMPIPWNKGKTGVVPWNKGKHGIYSEETLKKMSDIRKGQHSSPKTEFKKGQPAPIRVKGWNAGEKNYWYGRQHTEESKQKMRETRRINFAGLKEKRKEEKALKKQILFKDKALKFEELVKSRRGILCSPYKDPKTLVKIKCIDGHEFEKTPRNIQNGGWCNSCGPGISERMCRAFFETIFEKSFLKIKPAWLRNEKGNKMELDGYCEELKLAFEYNGIQHYKQNNFLHQNQNFEQRKRDDSLKRMQCFNEKGIILIEVPYTIPENDMERYILWRCEVYGVKAPQFRNIDYTKFNIYSPEKLKEAQNLAKAKGGECLSTIYVTARTKMLWSCKKDNHQNFEMTYDDVKSGTWCRLCSFKSTAQKKIKYSIPFFQELANKKNGKCLASEYISYNKKLRMECERKHQWNAKPGDLLKGTWCPYCAHVAKPLISDISSLAKSRDFELLSNEYKFHTDLMAGVLAKDVNLFKVENYSGGPFDLGEFEPVNGTYKLKIRETIEEADYFDEAKLVLVDAPKGYDVMTRWYYIPETGQSTPKDFVTIKDPKEPISAFDRKGKNVLFEVSKSDEVPVALSSKDDKTQVIIDFGNIEHPEYAKLILTGWAQYVSRVNEDKTPFSVWTTIETLNDKNEWVVQKKTIKNGGFKRSLLIDIPNILKKDNTKMRITMANSPVELGILDSVMLDDSVPVNVSVKYVDASVANLGYAGATNYIYPSMTQGGSSDDAKKPVDIKSIMYGNFTKYGDVRPLLDKTDDKFVVMASGDELAFEFKDPAKQVGSDRHAFFYADVFYTIKSTVKSFLTDSIYPIPFHGMKSYSYDDKDWKYRYDSDYREYLDTWNTRVIGKEKGTHTMYENSSSLTVKYIPEYKSFASFTSNKINLKSPKKLVQINFTADVPSATTVKFQIRSADTNQGLDTASWIGPDGTGATYYTTNEELISLAHGNPVWVQWKAYLATTDSTLTPKIHDVDLIVGNKVDNSSWATFIAGDGRSTLWDTFTPVQTLNNGTIDWYYSGYDLVESPCTNGSEWTLINFQNGVGQLGSFSNNYLCLRAFMQPDKNTNLGPEITSLNLNIQRQ